MDANFDSLPIDTSAPRCTRNHYQEATALMMVSGPWTYTQAMASADASDWEPAIAKEVAAMDSKVFRFIPEGSVNPARIIPDKWVLGLKLNANRTPLKWKPSLVARGDPQVAGGNCHDIYSAVVHSATIRQLLGLAAQQDYDILTLDVPTAGLGCPL